MDPVLSVGALMGRCRVILIVDDHPVMRKGLAQIVQNWDTSCVVHESDSVRGAIAACAKIVFDLVLLDLGLPDQSGLRVLSYLRAFQQSTPVAVISEVEQPAVTTQCLMMGAVAFLSKSTPFPQFEQELAHLLELGLSAAKQHSDWHAVARVPPRDRFEGLTPRQMEVLQWLLKGYSNKRIAKEVGLVPDTVKLHVGGIMKKFQVHSRGEVIAQYGSLTKEDWSGFQSKSLSSRFAGPSRL